MTVTEKEDMMRAIALAVAPLADELATTRESLHDSNALLNLREDRIRALEAEKSKLAQACGDYTEELSALRAELAALHSKYDAAEFWKNWVYPKGATAKQVQNELHDFRMLMDAVPKIYDHITGGRISKPNTDADTVISVHDDHVTEIVDEAVKEAIECHESDRIAALEAELAACEGDRAQDQQRLFHIESALEAKRAELAAELALRKTAEAYAARNALRVIELEELLMKAETLMDRVNKTWCSHRDQLALDIGAHIAARSVAEGAAK